MRTPCRSIRFALLAAPLALLSASGASDVGAAPAPLYAPEAAPPTPSVSAVHVAPSRVPSSGGTVTVTAVSRGRTCRVVEVLGAAHSARPCRIGTVEMHLHIGADTTELARTILLQFSASDGVTTRTTKVALRQLGRTSGPASPAVVLEPASRTAAVGEIVAFRARAVGRPTPTIQWDEATARGPWRPIPGARADTLLLAARSVGVTRLRAVFRNAAGLVATTPVTLTGTSAGTGVGTNPPQSPSGPPAAPIITSQPTAVAVVAGGKAVFTAAASGTPVPSVSWQYSSDGGATWTTVVGANASSYTMVATNQENGWEFRAVFANASGTVASAPAALAVSAAPPLGSANWAGYVATGGHFDAVQATFTVPAIDCSSQAGYVATWVGIDGVGSSSVEQDGVGANCNGTSAVYDAWYEMYGDNAVNGGNEISLPAAQYPVAAGDVVSVSVGIVAGEWDFAVHDATGGWDYTTQVASPTPAPKQESAEWIVERPEVCIGTCQLASLAAFGSETLSAATATVGGVVQPLGALQTTGYEITDGSATLAVPTALDPTGKSFTVSWKAAN